MGIVKILNKEIIDEIIRLYSTGECCSKEIIGKKFGTSKRVVSRILEENNVETIRTGTRNKIIPVNDGDKYTPTDEYTFIAKHKTTGKVFNDYNNSSGALISYLKETFPDIEIPTKFIRTSYYKKTGNYWYEQFFDIIKKPIINHKKKGELSQDDINKIIKLYISKEIPSTHKLGEMFKVGHKKISKILNEHDIDINKKGGLNVYNDCTFTKYDDLDDDHLYRAIHKKTGVVFDDYLNISGVLTRYIQDNNPDIEIPTLLSQRKRYFIETGNYWYEEFFDVVKFNKNELKIKKCPYCKCDIDMSASDIKYKNHILKFHNIDVIKHVNDYPKDKNTFKQQIKVINFQNNPDNWVTCKICGKKFGKINQQHLNLHNIKLFDYKIKYDSNNMSANYLKDITTRMVKLNQKGIMRSFISKPEKEIRDFLTSIGIKFETNRLMLIGKEIDILCHDEKIGIEFDGLKWHSEFFGHKDSKYHINKTIACNKQGYGLIHIFEDEWFNHRDLVEKKLKHIFNKDSDLIKIGARKTIIREIYNNEEKLFLNKYHIQGVGQSTISLGAFYNDELVGVMTFKKLSNDSYDYDLTRFATNYNYVYQGLASKMLSYFIKNNKVDSIISFADRRWTLDMHDNLYTKLGFKLDSILSPDYRYYNERVDKYKRFHKFGFRKQTLNKKYGLDLNLTETEMIKILGYDRIWDCGLFRYKLDIKKGDI